MCLSGVATYDRTRAQPGHITPATRLWGSPMGKIVMIVGLVVIGVVAGFVVRLLLPGRALGN